MKNKFLIILGILLLVPLVSAELILQPSSLFFSGNTNTNITQKLNITNTFSFPIYSLSFSGVSYATFPAVNELQPNISIQKEVVVNTGNSQINSNYNAVVSFVYYLQQPATPINYLVQVSQSGFSLTNLNLKMLDTITFSNIGSDNVSIKQINPSYLDIANLEPGQSYIHTISNIGTYIFYDSLHSVNSVNVNSISNIINVSINNPNYNKDLSININTQGIQSNISYSLSKSVFNISIGSSTEFALTLSNNGADKIYNVGLSGTWMSFSNNDFNLETGEDKVILVTITPIVNSTDDTNKTYTKNIIVSSDNAGSNEISVSIFVPYKVVTNSTISQERLNYLTELLKSILGELEFLGVNGTNIIFQTIPHRYNLTDDQISNLIITSDKVQRLQNDVNDQKINQENFSSSIYIELSAIKESLKDQNDRENRRTFYNAFMWIIIFLSVSAYTGYKFYKYYKTKQKEAKVGEEG